MTRPEFDPMSMTATESRRSEAVRGADDGGALERIVQLSHNVRPFAPALSRAGVVK